MTAKVPPTNRVPFHESLLAVTSDLSTSASIIGVSKYRSMAAACVIIVMD